MNRLQSPESTRPKETCMLDHKLLARLDGYKKVSKRDEEEVITGKAKERGCNSLASCVAV